MTRSSCSPIVLLTALLLAPGLATAQQPATTEGVEREGAETESSVRGDAPVDYEELEKMRALEANALAPVTLDSPGWDDSLLAPQVGSLASLRADHGLFNTSATVARGAALTEVPAVRARLARTEVLGAPLALELPQIRAYLDFFDGRGKSTLARWLARMGRYEPMIRQTLIEEGLPEDLIYVAMIESGFTPTARSPAAAVGVWQFIETTGAEMGLQIDRYVDERRDPIKATRAAARYLNKLHQRYNSWPLALAAYNGGPGLVDREISAYNSNDYWFINTQNGMYTETRRYVPKIMTACLISKNRDIFGLQGVTPMKPWDYELVELDRSVKLSTLGKAIGVKVEQLQELNPELKTMATPPASKDNPYELRIPSGSAPKFVAKFDKLGLPDESFELHDVEVGENIELIARAYEIKPHVLRAANALGKRQRLTYGSSIVIPTEARGTYTPEPAKELPVVFVTEGWEAATPTTATYIYEVNRGDSLGELARAWRLNPADIAMWNALDEGADLRRGMYLRLFFDEGARPKSLGLRAASEYRVVAFGSQEHDALQDAQKRQKTKGRRYHRVRSGQSLWLIARRYKTTVKQLKRLNPKLRRKNPTLQPGDKIRVR